MYQLWKENQNEIFLSIHLNFSGSKTHSPNSSRCQSSESLLDFIKDIKVISQTSSLAPSCYPVGVGMTPFPGPGFRPGIAKLIRVILYP